MDALVERLDSRLREWRPETANLVPTAHRWKSLTEPTRTDRAFLWLRRRVEQETLDLIDAPPTR